MIDISDVRDFLLEDDQILNVEDELFIVEHAFQKLEQLNLTSNWIACEEKPIYENFREKKQFVRKQFREEEFIYKREPLIMELFYLVKAYNMVKILISIQDEYEKYGRVPQEYIKVRYRLTETEFYKISVSFDGFCTEEPLEKIFKNCSRKDDLIHKLYKLGIYNVNILGQYRYKALSSPIFSELELEIIYELFKERSNKKTLLDIIEANVLFTEKDANEIPRKYIQLSNKLENDEIKILESFVGKFSRKEPLKKYFNTTYILDLYQKGLISEDTYKEAERQEFLDNIIHKIYCMNYYDFEQLDWSFYSQLKAGLTSMEYKVLEGIIIKEDVLGFLKATDLKEYEEK